MVLPGILIPIQARLCCGHRCPFFLCCVNRFSITDDSAFCPLKPIIKKGTFISVDSPAVFKIKLRESNLLPMFYG